MKKIYFLLCMLTISMGLFATITITPTTDVPSFKCEYVEGYSIAAPLGGTTNLSRMAALMKLVIVAEDGQQYWYPITESNYYTYTDLQNNIVRFHANGVFWPNADQVREIKNLKISAAFAVLYQLDVDDPKISIKSPDLHFEHSSILYHSTLETPTTPGTIVQVQKWTENLQSVIDNWDPSKVSNPPSSTGAQYAYNEYSDLNVLYPLDGTVQVVTSLTQKGKDVAQSYIKQMNLNFDDGTNLSLPVLTNIIHKDGQVYRVAGCSEPIQFSQLRDKFVTSMSIETYAGIVQGDNSKLVDALNDKISIQEYPSLMKSSYYQVLSHKDLLKTVPQIFSEEVTPNPYSNNELKNEVSYSQINGQIYPESRYFYMNKDKASKKFNLLDYTGKEIITPIFPKENCIKRYRALCYMVDECTKAGITQEMLNPIFDYANILRYYVKSTKEVGFFNRDGKKIQLNENDFVLFDNPNMVVVGQSDGLKQINWRIYNLDGEILATSGKKILMLKNGLIYKDHQFYYQSLEPIIPVDFPSIEYSQKVLWNTVESTPQYRITADGIMYFDNCLVDDPSGIMRNVVVAIPEKK